MKKYSFFFITIMLLSACGLEYTKVDINLDKGFIPEVAVSSYLTPDSLPNLKLMLTQAAYSTHNRKTTLNTAILLRISDNQTFLLSQNQKTDYIQLFSEDLKIIAGGIYKMRIETQNPTSMLESIDTIPEITTILDAEILPVDKSPNQLGKITLKPNVNSIGTTYYELIILICDKSGIKPSNIFHQIPITTNNQIVMHEDYYPSLLLIGAIQPQSLLFRINNPMDITNIDFLYTSGSAWGNAEGRYTFNHAIRIELRSISYAYFKYKTSLYKQINAATGDLLYGMAAPVKVIGNIKGGLGIFSGYSKCDTIINVAGRTGLPY